MAHFSSTSMKSGYSLRVIARFAAGKPLHGFLRDGYWKSGDVDETIHTRNAGRQSGRIKKGGCRSMPSSSILTSSRSYRVPLRRGSLRGGSARERRVSDLPRLSFIREVTEETSALSTPRRALAPLAANLSIRKMPASAEVISFLQPLVGDIACGKVDLGSKGAADRPSQPWYASLPDRQRHGEFLRDSVEVMLEKAVFQATNRNSRVLEWREPQQLEQLLDLKLHEEPAGHDKLLKLVEEVIKYSVKTGHPYFVNQLFSSVDPYGLVGQWLGDALNPSVYTYEVSPVFTLMEETVLHEMRKIVGFPDGQGDGIFCPGGSIANGYAISCARYKYRPEIKTKGLHGLPRLVLFTSEDAHYSVKKMASLLGIGSDNVYLINSDSKGKMDPVHLEQEIQRSLQEGGAPFMVSATAGTTVIGAFDPIPQIADICSKYQLWLHVDAAWGGGALMSKHHRHLLKGIERADSVTWNPHKLLTAPQQCSTFLVRHSGILSECHSASAQYLFQKDKFYDTKFDTGDKHIQCGRRADVLKFWFMWKAKGTSGLEEHINKVFDNAEYFTQQIKNREDFQLVISEPECTNICFWYIPPSLRGQQNQPDYKEKLHKIAPKIKERMMKEGSMMVTYQPLRNHPNFFRLVLQNSGLNYTDMDYFIEEIERLGSDL